MTRTHVLQTNSHTLISEFKEGIVSREGVASKYQSLVFNGRVLKDDKCIASYGICNNSTIALVVRLREGMARVFSETADGSR